MAEIASSSTIAMSTAVSAHSVLNTAVDVYVDRPDGVPSRVPLGRIVVFGYLSQNHEGSLSLMKMLGRNPSKDDEDALKGFLNPVWFCKELIDQAVSVSVLMLDDPFQFKWFGGASQPWVLTRPERASVSELRNWISKLEYITDRICHVTKQPRDSVLSEVHYPHGQLPANLSELFSSQLRDKIKELLRNRKDCSPFNSPMKEPPSPK